MDHALPNGTGGSGRVSQARIASNALFRAKREGRLTWLNLLEEWFTRAAAETNQDDLAFALRGLAEVATEWEMSIVTDGELLE